MEYKLTYRKSRSRWIALVMVICMMSSAFLGGAASAATSSADIRGTWSERVLLEWMAKDWLTGYPDGTVRPKNEVTRAEFFSLANKSLGYVDEATISFSDVKPGTWAAKQIAIAVNAGYVDGYPDGTMQPDRKVTREEVSVMVAKAFGLQLNSEATSVFTDVVSISNAGKGAVGALVAAGVLKGYPDGSFRPNKVITREEAVVILDGALKQLERKNEAQKFDASGTYGPATGIETVSGDAVVTVSGVTLRNMEIQGDLLLSASIGEGEATLDNVTVKGTVTVNGGGPNSIYLKDTDLNTLIVDKKNGNIRIVVESSTFVKRVDLLSSAKLVYEAAKDKGFGAIHLTKEMPAGSKVILQGEFAEVNVAASNVEIELIKGWVQRFNVLPGASGDQMKLEKDTRIVDLALDDKITVQGQGVIDRAVIAEQGKGSKFERLPGKLEGNGAPSPSHGTGDRGNPSPSPGTGGDDGNGGNQDTTPPAAPVVTGVQNEQIYAGPVTPNWSDASGTTSTATLIKDSSAPLSYTRNTEIIEDGNYILKVTARKNSNGLTTTTTIYFTIDSVPPAAPTIEGIADGGRYFSAVPNWTDAPGTVSKAMLSKDGHGAEPYERETLINGEGDYVLTVTVTKRSNGLTASTTIRFTIDSDAAVPAVIKGVEEGGVYTSATVTWTDALNMNSTATLARNGGTADPFTRGTEIKDEGNYVLTVTTQNVLSSRKVEQQIRFTISSGPPRSVEISLDGVMSTGGAYSKARLYWTDWDGTTSTAMLKKDNEQPIPYEMNEWIGQEGDYVLTVTTTKLSNGLTATATKAFKIVIAPPPPNVGGIINYGIYFDPVTMSFEPQPGTTIIENSLKNMETSVVTNDITSPWNLVEDGTYKFIVKVEQDGKEAQYEYQFLITGIRGVVDGETYASVTPTWVEPIDFGEGSRSEATLSKNGEPAEPYTKGTPIDEDGEYELTVTWYLGSEDPSPQWVEFTIDTVPPAPASITIAGESRTTSGERLYYTAAATWTDRAGTTSTAMLQKDSEEPTPYTKDVIIDRDGDYVLTVTTTKQSNGLTSTATREFKVDGGPQPPIITGFSDNSILFGPIEMSWTPPEGTIIEWVELSKSNVQIDPLSNPMPLDEAGEYEFIVGAKKGDDIRRFEYRFILAEISGVEDGGVYASATPNWFEPQHFGEVEALLSKGGVPVASYVKGDTITEAGEYVLTVTWRTDAGNSESKSIRFTIDSAPLAPVVVIGVQDTGRYFSAIPTWFDITGLTITATLGKDGDTPQPYEKGTRISELGSYILTVTAVKWDGQTAETTIHFEIDGEESAWMPEIHMNGDYNGSYFTSSVLPEWEDAPGNKSTPVISKDGSKFTTYQKGTSIDEDGDYVLAVTTLRQTGNGRTGMTMIPFKINKQLP